MLPFTICKKGVLAGLFFLLPVLLFSQTSSDYYEKAYNAFKSKDYSSAIYYAKKAVELNSSYYDAYGLMADAYYNLEDYRNAVDNYNKVLQSYSLSTATQAYYYYYRAGAKDKIGDYDGAIYDYTSCISKYSSDYTGTAYWERGVLYHNKKKDIKAAKSDYESAISYYTSDRKSSAILYANISGCEASLGNYDKALETANKSIEMDPEYYNGYMRQGYAYKKQGKYTDGIKSYSKALNLIKGDTGDDLAYIYFNLGVCQYSLYKYDEAIENLKTCLEKKSNFAEAYWYLGDAYYYKPDYPNSIKYYTLTLNYYQTDNQSLANIYRWRGKSYRADKQFQKAIDDYLKSISYYTEDKDKANVYSDMAWAYFYTGNITSGLANVDKAINLQPSDIYLASDKAVMLASKKNYKDAIPLWDKCISKYPTDDYYYFKRAYFKWMAGDKTGASEDFLKFKENAYSDTTRYMAIYQVFLGKKQNGIFLANEVLKGSTSDSYKKWDLYNLACFYSIAGNPVEALKSLEAAVKAGYDSFDWMQLDYELQNVQGKPEFIAFLKKHKAVIITRK